MARANERRDDELIDRRRVAQVYSIHPDSVSRFVRQGRIPRPVAQQKRFTRWSNLEIQKHIAAMRERARAEAAS
jgi:predicted DNA-binding transcriptional regulator AlpA